VIRSRYGTDVQCIKTFDHTKQISFVRDETFCYFADVPTLEQMNTAYTTTTAQQCLIFHLADLSEFAGAKEKMNNNQLRQLADIIVTRYPYLRITELMLFFYKFKLGEYEEFYGTVDPMAITKSLKEFIRERNVFKYRKEQEFQAEKERRSRARAVSREEYCRQHGLDPDKWNPLQRLADSFPAKDKPKEEDEAKVLESARLMVENINGLKQENLKIMFKMFEKKYGVTPQEYIKQHGEG
jgi:hypothetical protein